MKYHVKNPHVAALLADKYGIRFDPDPALYTDWGTPEGSQWVEINDFGAGDIANLISEGTEITRLCVTEDTAEILATIPDREKEALQLLDLWPEEITRNEIGLKFS